MLEKEFARERFVWWFSLCAAVCVALTLFPVSSSDLSVILYVVVTVPLVSLVLLGISYKRRGRQRLTALSAFALFVIFTAVLFVRFPDTTDAGRWLVFGKSCKAELLAQPSPAPTLLRHMEWRAVDLLALTQLFTSYSIRQIPWQLPRRRGKAASLAICPVRFSAFGSGRKSGTRCSSIPTPIGSTAQIENAQLHPSPSQTSWSLSCQSELGFWQIAPLVGEVPLKSGGPN